jgi:hypothetical protein
MTLQSDLRKLATDLAASTDVCVCEVNPTLSSATIERIIKDVTDHAKKASKTKTAIIISFVKRK